MSDAPSTVVRAQGLGLHALHGLSFSVGPGLTWVRGGEGRGKTTLLRVLAGQLVPATGTLERLPGVPWFEDPYDPAEDDTVAQAWLDTRRRRHRAWDRAHEARLAEALRLQHSLHAGTAASSSPGPGPQLSAIAATNVDHSRASLVEDELEQLRRELGQTA